MTIFINSFIFIVGFKILLFLVIDMATQLNVTSEGKADAVNTAGTSNFCEVLLVAVLMSVPVLVFSLVMGMSLVKKLAVDMFCGHPCRRHYELAG